MKNRSKFGKRVFISKGKSFRFLMFRRIHWVVREIETYSTATEGEIGVFWRLYTGIGIVSKTKPKEKKILIVGLKFIYWQTFVTIDYIVNAKEPQPLQMIDSSDNSIGIS